MFKFIEVTDMGGRRTIAIGHIIDFKEDGSRTVITLSDERIITTNENYGQVRDLLVNVQGLGI